MPTPPRFINPYAHTVGIVLPDGRKVYLHPFSERSDANEAAGRVYVVEGDFFADQIAPKGSLAPFPEATEPAHVAVAAPVDPNPAATPSVPATPPPAGNGEGDVPGAGAGAPAPGQGDQGGAGAGIPAAPAAPAGADNAKPANSDATQGQQTSAVKVPPPAAPGTPGAKTVVKVKPSNPK